jgi:hypothetical protein
VKRGLPISINRVHVRSVGNQERCGIGFGRPNSGVERGRALRSALCDQSGFEGNHAAQFGHIAILCTGLKIFQRRFVNRFPPAYACAHTSHNLGIEGTSGSGGHRSRQCQRRGRKQGLGEPHTQWKRTKNAFSHPGSVPLCSSHIATCGQPDSCLPAAGERMRPSYRGV